jgi:hypothetical protein
MARKPTHQSADRLGYSGNADPAYLQQQINSLQGLVQSLCQAQAVENLMINGVEKWSEVLAPLRDLGPKRRKMPDDTKKILRAVHESLGRPDYSKWSLGSKPNPLQSGEYSA